MGQKENGDILCSIITVQSNYRKGWFFARIVMSQSLKAHKFALIAGRNIKIMIVHQGE